MRMEQLKYLVEVAEAKSMSKAAERLFVSPQAVSKAIKQLEEELDATLLVRTSTGVEFTTVGESVVRVAENMLKEEYLISRIVAESKHSLHEDTVFSIRICSTSAITNIVLPEVIAKFSRLGAQIIPRIYYVQSLEELFLHLEEGRCDLGLTTYNEEELFRKFMLHQEKLDMDLLAQDEQVVVMDQHIYQPEWEKLSPVDFQNHFCSMFSMLPTDDWENDVQARYVMRSNDADFHRSMIKKANAYVLMPRLAYQHFFGGKSYVALPLDGERPPLMHAAVYRKGTLENIRKLISMIRLGLQ